MATVRTIERDGIRLACWDSDAGDGTPDSARPAVLLLHGLAGHAGEWAETARWLGERHRVVALDQRGHGASEHRPADVSRAAYVADVIAVVERLRLAPVVLVGQSLGGHTALLAAAARPDLVRALVLVDAGPGGPDPDGPARIGRWLDSWPVPFPSRTAASEFFGGGPVGAAWAAGLVEAHGGWRPRFDREVMVASLAETADRSHWEEWARLRRPTLVVLAGRGIVPAGDEERMRATGPADRSVLRIPDVGHDLHLEAPDALRAALSEFLARLAPAD